MKKNLIFLLAVIFLTIVLSGCSLLLGGGSQTDIDGGGGDINNPETMTEEDWQEMAEAYQDLFTQETGERKIVKGSCNVIADKSSCVDYTGSYWATNDEFMELNCQGAGVFSKDACPYTNIGGCINGPSTMTESVVWLYETGGSPTTQADKPYAQGACDANPMGQWTTPDQYYLGE